MEPWLHSDKFKTLAATSACADGEVACVNDAFAQCANGKFAITPCAGGLMWVFTPGYV